MAVLVLRVVIVYLVYERSAELDGDLYRMRIKGTTQGDFRCGCYWQGAAPIARRRARSASLELYNITMAR